MRQYLVNTLNGALMRPTPAAYKWRATLAVVGQRRVPAHWGAHRAVTVEPKYKIRGYALKRRAARA